MCNEYCKKKNFWSAAINNNASCTWNFLLRARQWCKGLIYRKIINGNNTNVWLDPWINGFSLLERYGWNYITISGGFSTLLSVNVWKGNLDYVPTHLQKKQFMILKHIIKDKEIFGFGSLAVVVNLISTQPGMKLETSI